MDERILLERDRMSQGRGRTWLRAWLLASFAVVASGVGAQAATLHFEISQANGINTFSAYNYVCLDCTIEQYAAMVLPVGFAKRNTRILVPVSTGGLPGDAPPGVPATLDLVPDLPDDDFLYCCEVVNGGFLGVGGGVIFNTALVRRSNLFTYAAGEVLHEVIDTLGQRYALFLLDLGLSQTYDITELGALSTFPLPVGWSYESRILSETLELGTDENGLAYNFGTVTPAIGVLTAWQRYTVVPEPTTALLLAGGLFGFGVAGRRALPARR